MLSQSVKQVELSGAFGFDFTNPTCRLWASRS
jgi:hypothetical protein